MNALLTIFRNNTLSLNWTHVYSRKFFIRFISASIAIFLVAFFVNQLLIYTNIPLTHFTLGIGYCILTWIKPAGGIGLLFTSILFTPEFKFHNIPNIRITDFLIPLSCILITLKSIGTLKNSFKVKSTFIIFILFYISVLILSMIINERSSFYSIATFIKYIQYFTLAFITFHSIKNKNDIKIILLALIGSSILGGYHSYFDMLERIRQGSPYHLTRAFGPGGETPNILGGFYLFSSLLLLSFSYFLNRKRFRFISFILFIALLIPFMYTYSRTSFISLVIGILTISILKSFKITTIISLILLISFIYTPKSYLMKTGLSPKIIERYTSILDILKLNKNKKRNTWGKLNSSWEARKDGWTAYYEMGMKRPILGFGMGSVHLCVDNVYIKKFYESGIIGLISFLSILLYLFYKTCCLIRSSQSQLYLSFSFAYITIIVSLLVHGIGVSNFTTMTTAQTFWILTGVLLAIHNLHARDIENLKQNL